MSTTVIASRHGALLYLFPAASRALDVEAVRGVLGKHGLSLVDGSDLASANEIVAAEGLEPSAAQALADDLRGIGLTVRVVNQTALLRSQRIARASFVQMIVAMNGLIFAMSGGIAVLDAFRDNLSSPFGIGSLALGAALIAWMAFNAIGVQRNGGRTLRHAGSTTSPRSVLALTDQLSDLREHLPEHVAAPLMERAERLSALAARDPDGQAARELQQLVDDLADQADSEAAAEARALRDEITRARRAMKETQGR